MLVGTVLLAAEQPDDLEEGDVDVYEAQTGDEAFERWFVPHGFEVGAESLEVVERPGIAPGDDDQKEADFEGENGETNGQQAALPVLGSNGGSRIEGDSALGKRAA